MDLEVHKFGGSSLADSDCFKRVGDLFKDLIQTQKRIVLILSAVGGVTNSLIAVLEKAAAQDKSYESDLNGIINKHKDLMSALKIKEDSLLNNFDADHEDLKDILRSIWLGRAFSELNMELVSGYGELWSTLIMQAYLAETGIQRVDARDILVVEHLTTGPSVDWQASEFNAKEIIASKNHLVITGYIAATADNVPTTLKRNGSDYSASIFGALLSASSIHIWSDVAGVMTADPRRVPEAKVLKTLSFKEALELAYFGAKVLHPKTMVPAMLKSIPLWIRSTFDKDNPGTKIESHPVIDEKDDVGVVKGFATIDEVSVINLEGAGMIGVPGIAENLFGALRRAEISVIMISQASSEYSISVAVKNIDGLRAKKVIEETFNRELSETHMKGVNLITDCCILAAVGDNMAHMQGVSGRLFGAMAHAHVNVRMIAQGSSERNISIVIDQKDVDKALTVAHAAFYLSHQTLSVGLIGVGLIGKTLYQQIESQLQTLKDDFDVDLRLRGITNSKKMLLREAADLNLVDLQTKGVDLDWDKFYSHIKANHIPHSVIIDCTASSEVSKNYPDWLNKGFHIITPNKKANSEDYELYAELKKYADKNTHYFYETTVGAGLPIISTLKDLILTGDKILKIEGVFSGTLSYIFNQYTADMKFSDVVKQAKDMGYTEPDPRDDLSGMDVARKVIILARESGLKCVVKDVPINSLVPKELQDPQLSIDEFMARLPDYDQEMAKLMAKAQANDAVLRFVGSADIENGTLSVGLQEFKKDHPFAQLKGSENIVQYTSLRYKDYPLIVRGPGAGAEVTAAGVFADLVRLSEILRASK